MGNFIGLVFGTLKEKGIDTSSMSVDEAIEKYNDIVNEVAKNTPKDSATNKKEESITEVSVENSEFKKEEYLYSFSKYGDIGVQNDAKLKEGSLEVFNKTLDGYFKKFDDLPKFNFITIDNISSSNVGGYVKEYIEEGRFVNTDLYINVGVINSFKYEPDLDKYVSNVACRTDDTDKRIKMVLDHEMMHKVLNYKIGNKRFNMDYYSMNVYSEKQKKLRQKMTEVWNKAIDNGDADNISFYASSSSDELIAEAYSARENGIEIPKYISDLIDEISNFKKGE